jgi:hypothetical protein
LEFGGSFSTARKKCPQTNNAKPLPRIARAAAQVTPAERRVEDQTVSAMAADKKNTWGKE